VTDPGSKPDAAALVEAERTWRLLTAVGKERLPGLGQVTGAAGLAALEPGELKVIRVTKPGGRGRAMGAGGGGGGTRGGAGGGPEVVLLIGKKSPTEKERLQTPPNIPGVPPGRIPPQLVKDPFRYAKLEGNPQVFEIREERLKNLFVPAPELRDPRVARFK